MRGRLMFVGNVQKILVGNVVKREKIKSSLLSVLMEDAAEFMI